MTFDNDLIELDNIIKNLVEWKRLNPIHKKSSFLYDSKNKNDPDYKLKKLLKSIESKLYLRNIVDEKKKFKCIFHLYNLIYKLHINDLPLLELQIYKTIVKYQ